MGRAIIGALRWAENPEGNIGWVAGVVEDSATTAGPCMMSSVPSGKHDRVLAAIIAPSTDRYHLLFHNCQHWAAKMLK